MIFSLFRTISSCWQFVDSAIYETFLDCILGIAWRIQTCSGNSNTNITDVIFYQTYTTIHTHWWHIINYVIVHYLQSIVIMWEKNFHQCKVFNFKMQFRLCFTWLMESIQFGCWFVSVSVCFFVIIFYISFSHFRFCFVLSFSLSLFSISVVASHWI